MDNNLKPCPFCGAPASLTPTRLWMNDTYLVKCRKCGATGGRVLVGLHMLSHGESDKMLTSEDAAREAVRVWNNRSASRIDFMQT